MLYVEGNLWEMITVPLFLKWNISSEWNKSCEKLVQQSFSLALYLFKKYISNGWVSAFVF